VASNMHARTLPAMWVGRLELWCSASKQHSSSTWSAAVRPQHAANRGFNGRWNSTRGADDQCWNPPGTAMLTCREQYIKSTVSYSYEQWRSYIRLSKRSVAVCDTTEASILQVWQGTVQADGRSGALPVGNRSVVIGIDQDALAS
jgi:hypothetical protein